MRKEKETIVMNCFNRIELKLLIDKLSVYCQKEKEIENVNCRKNGIDYKLSIVKNRSIVLNKELLAFLLNNGYSHIDIGIVSSSYKGIVFLSIDTNKIEKKTDKEIVEL